MLHARPRAARGAGARPYQLFRSPLSASALLLLLLEDLVDDPVLLRLSGTHVEVAIDVLRDLLTRLTRVLDEDLGDDVLHVADFTRLNLDVGRLAASPAERLVGHHARVRERI